MENLPDFQRQFNLVPNRLICALLCGQVKI
jgi:hypothetical protein